MQMPGFDIEADLAPLTALHQAQQQHQHQQTAAQHLQQHSPQEPFSVPTTSAPFTFSPSTSFPRIPSLDHDTERKVFFITNCGSLLGRTIAQVALDRGHFVAACAREKHLADLNVIPCCPEKNVDNNPGFVVHLGFHSEIKGELFGNEISVGCVVWGLV
jgi:hypothetical protein